jgi:hypothetical protein
MAQLIENHGIVGNLRTAALIGLDGAVDFLCWPQFVTLASLLRRGQQKRTNPPPPSTAAIT